MKKSNITKSIFILACLFGIATVNAQFAETTKIVSENRESRAEYGTSVDITENFAIVGTSRETSASGAAYMYSKDSQGSWSFAQKFQPTDLNAGAEFGGGVKFSDDYVVVAAGRIDIDNTIRAGALYVYDYENNNWEFDTKLVASDLSSDAKLGMNPTSLAVQGNTIVAGAPGENAWTGSVYVFTKVGEVWEETQKIMSPMPMENDIFGIGVAISGDYMLVGAQGVDGRKGAGYIYIKNGSGVWEYDQTISASNGAIDDFFGSSVSLGGDQIVVGSYGADLEKGTAYIYEKNAQDVWEEVQILNGNPSSDRVQFGWATNVKEDLVIVTAPHIYGSEVGEVYFYKKQSSGVWVEEQIIQGTDTAAEDFYGWSVAMYGNEMIVGSPREDHDVNGGDEIGDAGSAYIFKDPSILGGISDYENQNKNIRLYPNPAIKSLNIASRFEAISVVNVYSISGALVQQLNNVNQNFYTMDISKYSNGIYLVNIVLEDGSTTHQKIIVAN